MRWNKDMLGKLIKIIFILLLLLIIFIIWLLFLNNSSPEVSEPSPPQVFTISFDGNGGRLENAFQITDVEAGVYILDTFDTDDIIGIKDNHILNGWRLNSAYGDIISNTCVMPSDDIVLFANWLRNEEEPTPPNPPLLPGQFLVINETVFMGVDVLSLVTNLEFYIVTIPTNLDEVDFIIDMILDNLTHDAKEYDVTRDDILYWFYITVNIGYITISNYMGIWDQ